MAEWMWSAVGWGYLVSFGVLLFVVSIGAVLLALGILSGVVVYGGKR